MKLAQKLQIPPGASLAVMGAPTGFKFDLPPAKGGSASGVIFFAKDSKALMEGGRRAFEAAKRGELTWIAYPKAGKLGTDLSRDSLQELARPLGIEGVRIVSVDDVWSALRFRPIRAGSR